MGTIEINNYSIINIQEILQFFEVPKFDNLCQSNNIQFYMNLPINKKTLPISHNTCFQNMSKDFILVSASDQKKIYEMLIHQISNDCLYNNNKLSLIDFLYKKRNFLDMENLLILNKFLLDTFQNDNVYIQQHTAELIRRKEENIIAKCFLALKIAEKVKIMKKNYQFDILNVIFFSDISLKNSTYENHPIESVRLLKKLKQIKHLNDDVLLGIHHHHEYLDGSGLLKLSGKIIHEYGILISLTNDFFHNKDFFSKDAMNKYQKNHLDFLKKTITNNSVF